MKNPLVKRYFRELKKDIVKYLAIFLFMALTIGFISGFLVAGDSMKKAYDEGFEKYNIENGHFLLDTVLSTKALDEIEKEDITLHQQFYFEMNISDGSTIRVYKDRTKVNKVCLMKGEMPVASGEIAIDRMYADNNKLKVGDTIISDSVEYRITGLVALSDYSALYSNNNDTMFDAIKFGVGILPEETFDGLDDKNIKYCYAWKYNDEPSDEKEEKKTSERLAMVINANAPIREYVPRYINNAINFAGEDIGKDKSMMQVLLYILIVIMAFVFGITINHNITKEASAIGTLRASGYSKGEMLVHYMTLPIIVILIACIVGNVLGYTVFRKIIADLYYASYSMPTYVTRWNANAFVQTTVIPLVIMTAIIVGITGKRMATKPLKFLRHDFSRNKKRKQIKLPNVKFFSRFRLRIIMQNISGYVIMLFGISFAAVLLMFGLMMKPMLDKFNDDSVDAMFANYQYILKAEVPTANEDAEKACFGQLKRNDEEIMVYGFNNNSKYFSGELPEDGEIAISNTYSEKFDVEIGDTIYLDECYGDREYEFKVGEIIDYPASLCLFVTREMYNEIFMEKTDYFNAYLSNEELTDIDSAYIASVITEEDITKLARQLDVSVGGIFALINIFAVILSALLIFLLTRIIIEKNSSYIAMCKILGYRDDEVARLYLLATTWAVIVSVLASLGIATVVIKALFKAIMASFTGWISMYIKPVIYPEMFLIIFGTYVIIALVQFIRIKRIPKDQALKNFE